MSKLEVKGYGSTAEGELKKQGKAGYRFKRILIWPELAFEAGREAPAERFPEKAHSPSNSQKTVPGDRTIF